jgi:ankyrin repeat protein
MTIRSFFFRLLHSPISLLAIVMLIALACSTPACIFPRSSISIHDAAAGGDLAEVKTLLKKDPKLVSSRDIKARTALMYAAVSGHKDIAELLLAYKADVNAKDNDDETPLHWAANKDVAELLLANKAEVNAKGSVGWTPLHAAVTNKHKDVAELLLASKADINSKDSDGNTPLHWAAFDGYKDVAELLLAHRAEVNAKNNKGETPLHWAADRGFKDVVELLRQHGGRE